MVVTLEDRPAAAHVRRAEEGKQVVALGAARLVLKRRRRRPRGGRHGVARRLLGEMADRDGAHLLVVEVRAQLARVGDLADHREVELPAAADLLHRRELLRGNHRHHPFLALGDHDLDRREVGLPQGHPVEVDVEPCASAARHLRQRGGEAGGAEILERLDEPAFGQLEARLDQLLAGERVADLDGRALVLVLVGQLLAGEHAGAADAVAPGRGAVEDDEVARPGRTRARELVGAEQADAHGVDERVVPVGPVEDRLAADGRDADAVAVVADPADRPVEVEVRRAEAEPVEERDRPRAHRHDVAEDPADARGGALEGLDRRGVVVALHLEGAREPVAEVDDTRVLSRALQHRRALRGKPPQQGGRVLVPAVLRPEEREDAELEVVRVPPEQAPDTVVLPVREAESAVERLLRHGAQGRSPLYPSRRSARSAR